jgi:hypothetical protein
LAAVIGEHIDGGGGGGDFSILEIRPGVLLAEGDLEFEAAVFGKPGVFIGFEAAVGDDESGVARVFG